MTTEKVFLKRRSSNRFNIEITISKSRNINRLWEKQKLTENWNSTKHKTLCKFHIRSFDTTTAELCQFTRSFPASSVTTSPTHNPQALYESPDRDLRRCEAASTTNISAVFRKFITHHERLDWMPQERQYTAQEIYIRDSPVLGEIEREAQRNGWLHSPN